MKVSDILNEWGAPPMEHEGYQLTQEPEYEDDNVKIWHTMHTPDGERLTLNHTPYENITRGNFEKLVAHHKAHGRVPGYGELGPGNHRNEDLERL